MFLLPIKKYWLPEIPLFFQKLKYLDPSSKSIMEFIINILILIALVAILITLRDILYYSRLTVFKLTRLEPIPSTPEAPKAKGTLRF